MSDSNSDIHREEINPEGASSSVLSDPETTNQPAAGDIHVEPEGDRDFDDAYRQSADEGSEQDIHEEEPSSPVSSDAPTERPHSDQEIRADSNEDRPQPECAPGPAQPDDDASLSDSTMHLTPLSEQDLDAPHRDSTPPSASSWLSNNADSEQQSDPTASDVLTTAESSAADSSASNPFLAASAPGKPLTTYDPAPAAQELPPSATMLTLLFTWASLATIIAVWLWLKWPEARSHLEDLPDDGILLNEVVDPLESLSSRELVQLGETKQFGVLSVTPLRIENRLVRLLPDGKDIGPVLVLHLRVVNNSTDQTFCPTDPVFLYYHDPPKKLSGRKVFDPGYTYSFIHEKNSTQELLLPFDLIYAQNFRIDGQDYPRLSPGESADLMVISGEGAFNAVKSQMIWRVKLRKRITSSGKGIATVIGVEFHREQVATPPGPQTS